MPTLRKYLRTPGPYLGVLFLGLCLLTMDAAREPEWQVSARLYIALVKLYQEHASPALEGRIRCRYDPTCSRYSIGAVQEFGIAKGLVLTVRS